MVASSLLRHALIASFLLSATASCDQLGLGGKKEETAAKDKAESDESEEDAPKKKKKKKKSDDDEEKTPTATAAPTPAPTPEAPPTAAPTEPAASGEAKRYSGETPDSGSLSISRASPARKEADRKSEIVVTLQPGSAVTKVARYGGYQLVSWKNKSGEHFGWIETNPTSTTDRNFDAGNIGVEGIVKAPDAGPKPDAGTRAPVPDAGGTPKGKTPPGFPPIK